METEWLLKCPKGGGLSHPAALPWASHESCFSELSQHLDKADRQYSHFKAKVRMVLGRASGQWGAKFCLLARMAILPCEAVPSALCHCNTAYAPDLMLQSLVPKWNHKYFQMHNLMTLKFTSVSMCLRKNLITLQLLTDGKNKTKRSLG